MSHSRHTFVIRYVICAFTSYFRHGYIYIYVNMHIYIYIYIDIVVSFRLFVCSLCDFFLVWGWIVVCLSYFFGNRSALHISLSYFPCIAGKRKPKNKAITYIGTFIGKPSIFILYLVAYGFCRFSYFRSCFLSLG